MIQCAFFLLIIPNCSRVIYRRNNPFSTDLPLHLYLKSVVSTCMDLFLTLSCCSSNLFDYCDTNTTLLITKLCKSWNQVVLVLQIYTFSKLFWLFQVLSISMLLLDLSFKFQRLLAFWLKLHWIYISNWGELWDFWLCKSYNLALI